MIPSKYVRESAKNCANYIKDNFPSNYTFPARSQNPFVVGYEDVMYTSKILDPS